MTVEDVKFGLVALTAIFFVVDPFAAAPIFLAITAGDDRAKRLQTALRAALAAFVALSFFAVLGTLVFRAFGISLGAFKIAGGLMLFLMSVDMMRAQASRTRSTAEEEGEAALRPDVAVVPMAIPVLAGPGAIATVMVMMSRADWIPVRTASVLGAVALTCFATWLVLRWATVAERVFTRTTVHVLQRVMGLLLAAVAVEFVAGGLRDLFPGIV